MFSHFRCLVPRMPSRGWGTAVAGVQRAGPPPSIQFEINSHSKEHPDPAICIPRSQSISLAARRQACVPLLFLALHWLYHKLHICCLQDFKGSNPKPAHTQATTALPPCTAPRLCSMVVVHPALCCLTNCMAQKSKFPLTDNDDFVEGALLMRKYLIKEKSHFWSHYPCLQSSAHGISVLAPPDRAGLRSGRAPSTMLALLLPLVTNGFHRH